jgi:undecaprenyl-diphosphatase
MDENTSPSHAVILGVLQGLTEFLPVSSSAHLIVVSTFMDGKTLPLALNVALHLGTLGAVILYFWKDWLRLATACVRRVVYRERSFEADTLLPALLIGSIPAGVIGILWNDLIEAYFHNPVTVVAPLAIVGVLLWWVDKTRPLGKPMQGITLKDGFLIGCGQALALIPGVSRSGATILTGRLLGVAREDAARFSFMLGTPAMCGAALLKRDELLASTGDPVFIWGTLAALVSGCLAIAFFLRFLRRFGFGAFALYRVVLAGVILALVLK